MKDELAGKVLLPILGDQYGAVLDSGQLRLTLDDDRPQRPLLRHGHAAGAALVGARARPPAGRAAGPTAAGPPGAGRAQVVDRLARHAPGRRRRRAPRRDGSGWPRCSARAPAVRAFLEDNVRLFNGTPGDPHSFDLLDELLGEQAYRLAYWRVAGEEINYRRFFDINELAAIRMEEPEVFEETHRLVFDLVGRGRGHRPARRPPRRALRAGRVPAPPAARLRPGSRPCRRHPVLRGRREDPGPRRAPARGVGDGGDDRLRVPEPRQRHVRRSRPGPGGRAGCTRARSRAAAVRGRGRRVQAADHGDLDGLRDQHARPPPRPHLREAPLLARLHAGQPHHRPARDHRGLPGLPDLRRRVGGAPGEPAGQAATRSHRSRPRVHRPGGRPGQAAHADHERAGLRLDPATSSRCASRRRPARPTARSGWTSSCASSRSPGRSPPRATRTPSSTASTGSSRSTRWAATPAASAPRWPSSTPRTSSGVAAGPTPCRRPPPTTPSAARTCARASTCSRRSRPSGGPGCRAWQRLNRKHHTMVDGAAGARRQHRVPALPDAGRRLADRRRRGCATTC